MQKIRQILLLLSRGHSERAIAKQTQVSRPTIHHYSVVFSSAGSDYSTFMELADQELNMLVEGGKSGKVHAPDLRKVHFVEQADYFISELRKVGVTRYLLWQEYLEAYPDGFQYSRCCELLDTAMSTRKHSMHLSHIRTTAVRVDDAVGLDFTAYHGHQRPAFRVIDHLGIDYATVFEQAEDGNFARGTPAMLAFANATKVTLVKFDLAIEWLFIGHFIGNQDTKFVIKWMGSDS